jgi:hypothetical protein
MFLTARIFAGANTESKRVQDLSGDNVLASQSLLSNFPVAESGRYRFFYLTMTVLNKYIAETIRQSRRKKDTFCRRNACLTLCPGVNRLRRLNQAGNGESLSYRGPSHRFRQLPLI